MLPLAQVSQHAVPLQISMGKGVATRTAYFRLPMLLPEMIWHRLWNSSYFKTYILEDANMLPRFWASCGQHPGLLKHPVKRIPNYQHRAVPVVLHGDGAAVTLQLGSNSKSCLFLSFRSLTASTPKHFLMAAVWTSACGKSKSFNTAKRCQKHFQSGVKILCEIIQFAMHGWLLPSTSMDDWRSRIFLRLSSNCTVEFTVTVQFMFGYIAKLKKSADNRFSVAGARSLEGTARACVTSVHNCDDCPRYCA